MDPSFFTQVRVALRRWWNTVVDRYFLWGASVHGVEVTQSIQYYRAAEHLTDAADRGADNSVRLVAYKAAWVRVYVRPGIRALLDNVTGTLELARSNRFFGYDVVATYTPQAPFSVTADSTIAYDAERGNINSTLNFIIPAEQFHGSLRLTVRLDGLSAVSTTYVSARLIQTLRVRAILVSYNGPSTSVMPPLGQPPPSNLTLAAPTLADVQTTAALALTAMPVQATGSFASAGTLPWTLPLDDPRSCAGCCSANWGQLLTQLTTMRTNDGNRADVVYYGLLPAGMPLNVPGCGNNGLGSAAFNDQGTFIHEIGHGYGFTHTPCGNAGGTDLNYPTYEPYGAASIGEYGLDIRNGNILDPDAVRDYMSYCFPQWMSLYQHNRLIEHARLDPRWISDRPWWDDYLRRRPFEIPDLWLPDPPPWLPDFLPDLKVNPVISIIGEVLDAGEVHVSSVARVPAAGQPVGIETSLVAQLLDETGKPLARGPVVRLEHEGSCDCGGTGAHRDPDKPPYRFQAFVPDVAPGAALRILAAEKEVWIRRAPAEGPRFERVTATVARNEYLTLNWEVRTTGDAEIWAQWSRDDGKRWNGLSTGLSREKAELPLSALPGGRVAVRLLAHDGFYTAVSAPVSIELPERAPEVAILHPRNGQTLMAGHAMQLAGSATDNAGVPIPSESLSWTLDDASVGNGREVWSNAPDAGEHVLVLSVRWHGSEAKTVVRFKTERSEQPPVPKGRKY
jgi:peptidase M66-like protein